MNRILTELKKIMDNCLETDLPGVSRSNLEDNGAVFYMNGNNGTEFDWYVNEKLSSFMIFYNDKENLGAVKATIYDRGEVVVYTYGSQGKELVNETQTSIDATEKEMLELVGLAEHLNKKPRQLSGGQQQRVAIARTLALNPDVILFDEPMSALDVDTRLSLRSELKELQRRFGTTMIYITHDQEEAFAMSDRIMVMDAGVIHQLDTPQNIIDNPADDYVRRFVIDNINIKIDSLIQFARVDDDMSRHNR